MLITALCNWQPSIQTGPFLRDSHCHLTVASTGSSLTYATVHVHPLSTSTAHVDLAVSESMPGGPAAYFNYESTCFQREKQILSSMCVIYFLFFLLLPLFVSSLVLLITQATVGLRTGKF